MEPENPEGHNLEFKEAWRDEYLKVICAYANGGRLLIGVDEFFD